MHQLTGRVQHYPWGGNTFIPSLLSQENSHNQPFAEYWLGVHSGGPSRVFLGQRAFTFLPALINSDKTRYLGASVTSTFGNLPFLLKVLDVKDMLSIQVHPSKASAEEGFSRENEAGISLDAPNRNYKDTNHKPEVMVALSDDFWLLHGFSPEIDRTLEVYDFLNPLKKVFVEGGIRALYQYVMELPQHAVDELIGEHAKAIMPKYLDSELDKSSPDFWAARAIANMGAGNSHFDRGIFSIYLFNIVHLKRGEGIFQGAGMPHAYLEGQNIELMSNSDNVLRAGLTPKYVDIPELIRNTSFVPTFPEIIHGDLNKTLQEYSCPVPDFTLFTVFVRAGEIQSFLEGSPKILLVMNGIGWCLSAETEQISTGMALFLGASETLDIRAESDLLIFIASVPF